MSPSTMSTIVGEGDEGKVRSANARTDTAPERPEPTRLRLLAALAEDLPEPEAVALALQHLGAGLGALAAAVHLRDPASGELRLAAISGLPREHAPAWAHVPADADATPAHAVRDEATALGKAEFTGIGVCGTVSVPLAGAGGPVGALSVITAVPERPDDAGLSFLSSVAAWVSGRVRPYLDTRRGDGRARPRVLPADRARHGHGEGPSAGERMRYGRTARMQELTEALSEAVTSTDVVNAAAEQVLPPLGADGLIVQALDAGRLEVVGSVGYPADFLRNNLARVPLDTNVTVADVLRHRTPRFVRSLAEFSRLYPELTGVAADSGKQAWAFLPLISSGQALGSCVVSFSRPRSFTDEERIFLIALSGLLAQALERARLYDAEHHRAQKLQRGLLPRTLPDLPAVTAAARYLPAGQDTDVGGDWYDMIPLSADRVALVVGDVMGHGIAEAATMGRLRTAVRTLADLELPPDEVLTHLNDIVGDLGNDYYATCLYAVFDPVDRTCVFAGAGHPSPALVRPDGTVERPRLPTDPPLGAAEPPFDLHELRLPEESLLVFCTDGLIESATRDSDEGLTQLTRTLAAAAARTPYFGAGGRAQETARLDDLCDIVLSALLPDRAATSDDAALLIAHTRHTAPADIVSWTLPMDVKAARQAREHVQRQLALWDLDELVATTELLVSELVGNAVRHARGPIGLRLLRSRSLICEVSDGSLTTPRIRRAAPTDEGGRGLQLVAAIAQRWGTRYTDEGKCIWTEQDPLALG